MTSRLSVSPDGEYVDQLERLHDSLVSNAEWFRKSGHEGCAFESESIAARLRNAMEANHG